MTDLNMSEAFRAGCEKFGITEVLLRAALTRSNLNPSELMTIETTTSSRNFRVSYHNKAGEPKWAHLFVVVPPAAG